VLRQLTRLVPPGLFAGRHGGTDAELRVGWRIAGLLAVSQTVGYGVLYYSFSVFLTPIAGTLHASATAVTGALTASLLAGAAAAVPVGRHLDRHGGRGLMTWGSAAGTPLSAAQLNATASVPGTFVATSAAGSIPGVGSGPLVTVTCTPAAATRSTTATASVPIDVATA